MRSRIFLQLLGLVFFLTTGGAQLHDALKFKEWQKLPIANRMQLILCSFITYINELCLIVKSQRSGKLFWFLPIHKANAKKPKELAPPNRT